MSAWHLFNALDITTMKCPLTKESEDCVVWAYYPLNNPLSLSKAIFESMIQTPKLWIKLWNCESIEWTSSLRQ